ncbi:hypothetical protein AAMO2058_000203200 [Amorphochlora amoebiformis]
MESPPQMSIPDESLTHCLSFLPLKDVLRCAQVCKQWLARSKSNAIWGGLCDELWRTKAYVPMYIRAMKLRNSNQAYFESLRDSKRQHPTLEELCEFEWCFRFKESAGAHWIQIDPYWSLDHKDSKIAQTIIRRFMKDGTLKRLDNFDALRNFSGSNYEFKWRTRDSEGEGKYIKRIQVNHFPSYITSRHPRNWGFIMQSCWVLWTSFPMPAPGHDDLLVDQKLEVKVDDQMEEVDRYNYGDVGNLDRVIIETPNGPVIVPFTQLAQHLNMLNDDGDDMGNEGEGEVSGRDDDEEGEGDEGGEGEEGEGEGEGKERMEGVTTSSNPASSPMEVEQDPTQDNTHPEDSFPDSRAMTFQLFQPPPPDPSNP